MSVFRRSLSADECAVVVKRGREPRLVCGPGSVRTLWRWRRVVVIDRRRFALDIPSETLLVEADVVTVSARVEGQVVDPIAAALKVVDYEDATRAIARTAIRAVMRNRPSTDLVSAEAEIEAAFVEAVDEATRSWGVVVSSANLRATGS